MLPSHRLYGPGVEDLGAEICQLSRFAVVHLLYRLGVGHHPGVSAHESVDISPDLHRAGIHGVAYRCRRII
ncbi:hypothetical protein SDC9_161333 [bioreactor metagenome]|uniref:Uncharacterized protein n=1 Tax=bioreactor metagenome TaxID=1076179 RepID=A0A645FI20_9ZZZZ